MLFCALPKTHDFQHHGYVKYIKSWRDRVDMICLVTSNRFNLITAGTYWPELTCLYDHSLEFSSYLAQQANRELSQSDLQNHWKYQALFDNGSVTYLRDFYVSDVRQWLLTRMKEDNRWKSQLIQQDAEAIKALKLLLHKPEFVPAHCVISMFKDTLTPMLMYDHLWPNIELENLLRQTA